MNAQKFTQKSLEAVQSAQNLAIENQNAQIEEMHLFLALLEQENSLIEELFDKINPNEKRKENHQQWKFKIYTYGAKELQLYSGICS